MIKSRMLLMLEGLKWLIERQIDRERAAGEHLQASHGEGLAEKIRDELQEAWLDKASGDRLEKARGTEQAPVHEGQLKEDKDGEGDRERGVRRGI